MKSRGLIIDSREQRIYEDSREWPTDLEYIADYDSNNSIYLLEKTDDYAMMFQKNFKGIYVVLGKKASCTAIVKDLKRKVEFEKKKPFRVIEEWLNKDINYANLTDNFED